MNMRNITTLLFTCILAACAPKERAPLTDAEKTEILSRLEKGEITLECQYTCKHVYGAATHEIRRLQGSEDWIQLVNVIEETNVQYDHAYYNLAVVAEMNGYFDAAKKYYNLAITAPDLFQCAKALKRFCRDLDIASLSQNALNKL